MTHPYTDGIESLEMTLMSDSQPETTSLNSLCDEMEQDSMYPNMPVGYFEIDPEPRADCSRTVESNDSAENDFVIRLEAALDRQAPTIEADFSLDELLPTSVARAVKKSSSRSQSDPIALSMMLKAATGSLLGSKLRVNTQYGTPLAGNLYLWLVGDTSTKKSRIAKKITNPLFGVKFKERERIEQAIAVVKKKESSAELKREEIEALKNNQRLQFFESLDISEQGLIKQLSRQAPLQGLHMHLDEGSDLFNGVERYSGNRAGSGVAKTGLLRNLLLTGWVEPLRGSGAKADEERCIDFDEQTLTLTANIQQQFLPQILDLEEDSQGFAARHDLILVTSSLEPMSRESKDKDPASIFMIDRLIPFCQSIRLNRSHEYDDTGNNVRYNVCEFSSEAQELYDNYIIQVTQQADAYEQQEIEPAFTAYLRKVGIRLGKLALIQHALEALEGAKKETSSVDFDCNISFGNANKRVDSPISALSVQRAINWCITLCKQRQLVVDSTRSAPMKREAQLILGEQQNKMSHILDKLQNKCVEHGSQSRSKFIANTKGTRNMSRSEVSDIIDALISRGCIEQFEQGKALMLLWSKPLREARS